MYLLLRGSCCGCYFSHLSCLYCYTTVRLIIKALLTTTLGVVSLLQETEPLFLWKLLFPIKIIGEELERVTHLKCLGTSTEEECCVETEITVRMGPG